jgi:hypothetical protein
MTTVTPAATVDEQFWALVCADEELLRAEFDEIVGGWSDAAGSRPFAFPVGGGGPDRHRARPASPVLAGRWPAALLGPIAGVRQRSPPAHRRPAYAACPTLV